MPADIKTEAPLLQRLVDAARREPASLDELAEQLHVTPREVREAVETLVDVNRVYFNKDWNVSVR